MKGRLILRNSLLQTTTKKSPAAVKCRAKYYRQQAAEERRRECVCGYCGKTFTATRSDVKYCSEDCRYKAQIKRRGERKAEERKQKADLPEDGKEQKTA